MKRIYILIAAVCILFTACDSFTDIKPVGKVIPTTYQELRDVMTYAYSTVPKDRSLTTIRGDELQLRKDYDGYYKPYEAVFVWNDMTKDVNTIEFPWQQFYKSVMNANQIIEKGNNIPEGTKEEIEQLQAEAYLLRAYMHFGLANLYSDVYSQDNLDKKSAPIATVIDIWQNYKPATVQEIYKQIVSDLEKGIGLLNIEEQPEGFNYRFSKVSAYGFAARLYLYMGEWKTANDYAKKAYDINNTLIDLNSEDAVLPIKYSSDENVFALEQAFNIDLKFRFNISTKLAAAFDKENDKRFATYFEANGSEYRWKQSQSLETKVSMRTAEFYLMLAETEAKMEGGNLTMAKQYLKDLIVKRLTPDYYTTEAEAIDAMDKNAFIECVADERFRELACQGFRWFDLRRNGKSELSKEFDGKAYTLESGDLRYVIPFPREAVANNPNLRQ